jgi:hypothetical protein
MQATLKQALYRLCAPAIVFIALAMSLPPAAAPKAAPLDLHSAPAVLVMVGGPGCPYCARWEAEVGHSYRASKEGKFAPLVVHLRGDTEISNLKKIVYSPTFVMLAYGQEVGRIIGYQGSDLFWMQLEPLAAKAGFAPAH